MRHRYDEYEDDYEPRRRRPDRRKRNKAKRKDLAARLKEPPRVPEDAATGRVVAKHLGRYSVLDGGARTPCVIGSLFRKRLALPQADPASSPSYRLAVAGIRQLDPVAVGDRVRYRREGGGDGVILDRLPRRTRLSRLAAGQKPLEQVIAANVDQLLVVLAGSKPVPKATRLDRYLVEAAAQDLPCVVCVTKIDEGVDPAFAAALPAYEALGYPVLRCCAFDGRGMEELRAALAGKVSVLLGASGVGKTTLLNGLQPGLGLAVNEVSGATGKGRHTTTHLELHALEGGGGIIDTPGMREFGLWRACRGDLARWFPDFRPHLGGCRFGEDCAHLDEPGCAVKAAVEAGEILATRYRSYVRLQGERR